MLSEQFSIFSAFITSGNLNIFTITGFLSKIMASGPITSWQTDGEKMETVTDLIFLGSKMWVVPAAMKLKDAYSLEEKL